MIDIKLLREDPDLVRASQRARGEDEGVVDAIRAADERRRSSLTAYERLRAEQKSMGKDVARAQGDEKQALLARTKEISAEVKTPAGHRRRGPGRARRACCAPSATSSSPRCRPAARTTTSCVETVGTARDFAAEGFEPRDHLALAEGLDAIDMERGAKVAGARFYFLKGAGARLEMGLLALAMQRAIAAGFVPMITPTLVKSDVMAGAGLPRPPRRRGLPARGRRPLPHRHLRGRAGRLPRRRGHRPVRRARSATPASRPATAARPAPTARTPAASSGCTSSTRSRCSSTAAPRTPRPSTSGCSSSRRRCSPPIEVPYRIIDTAAGDLGGPAARKYDCEAWVPTQGRYRELTSTSNCTTFQARRLNTRFKGEHGNEVAATLNGTLATTRWIVAILENHQQADGSVVVPEALRPHVGLDVLTPVR